MSFGQWGSATDHNRYMQAGDPKWRRRCNCGCKKVGKFIGMANGVGLTTGCEMYIRRWVRDGIKASSVAKRQP